MNRKRPPREEYRYPSLSELCFGPNGPTEDDEEYAEHIHRYNERQQGINRLEDRLAADGQYDGGVTREQRKELARLYDSGER